MIRNSQKFKVLSSKKRRKSDKDIRIIFPESLYRRMRASFDGAEAVAKEGYAIAQCGYKSDSTKAVHARKSYQYLVKSIHVPAQADLFEQSSITVTPGADFMEGILSEAAEHDSTILEVHTHVDSATPNFSWVDIENGIENGRFLKSCGLRFAMAVIGADGFSLSEYEADHDAMQAPASARITLATRVGRKDALRPKVAAGQLPESPGVSDLRVAIVGLNGVGSHIAHKLAGMGLRKFILFDDRVVDGSEILPYALAKDTGKKRTKVLHRSLKTISKDLEVLHVNDSAGLKKEYLRDCDVIFGCVGGHEDRLAMNEMSLKYFIPFIDVGAGEVRVIAPSANGCLGCLCGVPSTGRSPASEKTPDADRFIASIAVQELIDMLNGTGSKTFDHIRYCAAEQNIDLTTVTRDEHCPLCGKGGILGAGDEKKKRS
jgi:molybdopterin-synthase adenylyltransferase